nr:MAG: hypothetical protein DIU78_02095 [Pseudomonadota bacterium]
MSYARHHALSNGRFSSVARTAATPTRFDEIGFLVAPASTRDEIHSARKRASSGGRVSVRGLP